MSGDPSAMMSLRQTMQDILDLSKFLFSILLGSTVHWRGYLKYQSRLDYVSEIIWTVIPYLVLKMKWSFLNFFIFLHFLTLHKLFEIPDCPSFKLTLPPLQKSLLAASNLDFSTVRCANKRSTVSEICRLSTFCSARQARRVCYTAGQSACVPYFDVCAMFSMPTLVAGFIIRDIVVGFGALERFERFFVHSTSFNYSTT